MYVKIGIYNDNDELVRGEECDAPSGAIHWLQTRVDDLFQDWYAEQFEEIKEECELQDYNSERYKRFAVDMYNAGFADELRHYNGRFWYKGPAVECEMGEQQKVIQSTSVELQWDQMGLGLIGYVR